MPNILKIAGAATLALAVPASAGEVTGNGGDTPIDGHIAASICSFSGLNDDSLPTSDRVQAYGMIIRSLGGGWQPFGPGSSCRGN